MSLDKNLFTLLFTPNNDHPNVIDLVDPSGTVHYRKQRVLTPEYKIEVYDPMSESLLATAAAPAAISKFKTIELCNPTSIVELKYTGTLSFRWSFKWEEHEFEWKKEECFMIRKPDPPVIIAVTKDTPGRLKTTSVQILDYNLNRFEINDRKGLEIVVLTALLTFQDNNEAQRHPDPTPSLPPSSRPLSKSPSPARISRTLSDMPPAPPPKPAPRKGVDGIAEMQAMKGDYNEIIIGDEGDVHDYAEYCNNLLQDDAMLFITLKSDEAIQVPKVLQVVEETKRIRYKAGLSEEAELHQYVLYDTKEGKKGPRRINLDDDMKNKYAPPQNLTVHLSKISMPELQPKIQANEKPKEDKKKEDKKDKITTKTNLGRPASATPAIPQRPSPSGSSNNLQRSGRSQSPSRLNNNIPSKSTPPPTAHVSTKQPPNSNSSVPSPVPNQQSQTATSINKHHSSTARVQGFFDMLAHHGR